MRFYCYFLFFHFSDIDLVVMGEWESLPLFTLEQALLDKGITNKENIKVLDKASVSVLDFIPVISGDILIGLAC